MWISLGFPVKSNCRDLVRSAVNNLCKTLPLRCFESELFVVVHAAACIYMYFSNTTLLKVIADVRVRGS